MSAPPSARSEVPDTREKILVEASALFGRHGYAGTTTRAIAGAVQIRQPSLFHHFESKAAIMDALLRHSLDGPERIASQLALAPGSPASRLAEYLRFDIEHIYASPYDLVGLHSREVLEQPVFGHWRNVYERLRAARRTLIADGMRAGELIAMDVDLADDAVTGLLAGALAGRSRRGPSPHEAAAALADFALRALRPGAEQN